MNQTVTKRSHPSEWFKDNFFLLIVSALILFFILFPVVAVLLRSFRGDEGFTIQYYQELFNTDLLTITLQSIALAVSSAFLTTVTAYFVCLGIVTSGDTVQKWMRRLLYVTIISPPFITAIAMIELLGRRGFISYQLFNVKWDIYGPQGIFLIQLLSGLSFGIMILLNSFDTIDQTTLQASGDLGAKPGQTLLNIVMPQTRPGFWSVFFILFTMNFADFGTPVIIGGRFQTIATEAYKAIISTGELARGAAMSSVMLPFSILAFIFYIRMMKREQYSRSSNKGLIDNRLSLRLPKALSVVVKILLVAFVLFQVLKYGTIILSTMTTRGGGSLTFTTRHFQNVDTVSIEAFGRSIIYAFIAAFVSVVVGVSLSYYIYRRKKSVYFLEWIGSLPYILPGTFFGLGYLVAFTGEPFRLTGTAAIVILNLSFRQISVANKQANALYPLIDQNLEAAAKDLGAKRFDLLRTVTIPVSLPIVATSFAQIFTSSMTAFGAVIFLVSPGKLLASTEMFRQIKGGGNAVGSILAVMIIVVTAIVNLSVTYLLKRRSKQYVS